MAIETPESALKVFSSPVYKIRIKVGAACGTLSVERKDDRAEVIKANGGKSKDSLPIYQIFEVDEHGAVVFDAKGKPQVAFSAKQAQNALANALDALQAQYMLASGDKGLWYCPTSKIEELDAEIKKLEVLRDDLLDQLTTSKNYHTAKMIYEQACYDALEQEEINQALVKFPSINEISEKFRIEVLEWEPLPSLEELQEQAGLDTTKQRQLEAVQRVMEDLQSKAPDIISEGYELFARMLDLIERQKLVEEAETYNKCLDRLCTLLEFWKTSFGVINADLDTMKVDVELIGNKAVHTTDSEAIEDACNELRAKWRTSYKLGHSDGASKLNEWLYPERGLESQINTLIQQIKDELDEEKRLKLEKKLHTKKDLLTYKVDLINQQIKFILGDDAEVSQEVHDEQSEPLATTAQLKGLTLRHLRTLYKTFGNPEGMVKPELIERLVGAVTVADIDALKDTSDDAGF